MRSRSRLPPTLWSGTAAALAALLLLGAWGFTLHQNAWARHSPRYACIHRGNVVLLSTMWRAGEKGVRAWSSDGWMYDVRVPRKTISWRPWFADIGTVYSGTPAYRAPLSAIFVPLWTLALAPGALAIVLFRRPGPWRAKWCCGRCGYDLSDLAGPGGAPSTLCPECGTPVVPTSASRER